jgi:hypothetical protein
MPHRPLDDVGQCGPRQIGIDAAQGVVGAELDDDAVGSLGDRPVEPVAAARGGVAGHAGVGHVEGYTFVLQGFFELGRERILGREAKARTQGIAEDHELDRFGRRLSLQRRRCRDRHQTEHQHGYVHEQSVTPLDRAIGVAI